MHFINLNNILNTEYYDKFQDIMPVTVFLLGFPMIQFFGASIAERHLGITLSVVRPSVCLSVGLSVRLSHFWFAYNSFTFRGRAFIFGMCVPYDNTFPMVP